MTNTEKATTILDQLGGAGRLAAMIGARDLLALDGLGGVQFKIGRGAAKSISCIRIEIDALDTYTVRFYAGRGLNVREVSNFPGMYAEDLRRLIEGETGFVLSLGTLGR